MKEGVGGHGHGHRGFSLLGGEYTTTPLYHHHKGGGGLSPSQYSYFQCPICPYVQSSPGAIRKGVFGLDGQKWAFVQSVHHCGATADLGRGRTPRATPNDPITIHAPAMVVRCLFRPENSDRAPDPLIPSQVLRPAPPSSWASSGLFPGPGGLRFSKPRVRFSSRGYRTRADVGLGSWPWISDSRRCRLDFSEAKVSDPVRCRLGFSDHPLSVGVLRGVVPKTEHYSDQTPLQSRAGRQTAHRKIC